MDFISTLFICFTIYSFIGWVCETILCSYLEKKFVNRGFLNGPFCPVYGFGAVLLQVTFFSLNLELNVLNVLFVFVGGALLTTILEYFTGWLLETLFNTTWWDYSKSRFNIKGRVCLTNSLAFGVMSVALIFIILGFVQNNVERIPDNIRLIISIVLLVYYLADIFVTIKSMQNLNVRLEKISVAFAAIKEKFTRDDNYDELTATQKADRIREIIFGDKNKKISGTFDGVREKIANLINNNERFQRRIIMAFPHLRSKKYPELLTVIKDKVLRNKNNQDNKTNQQ